MQTKCRSIATFHRPIHSHWPLPLTAFLRMLCFGMCINKMLWFLTWGLQDPSLASLNFCKKLSPNMNPNHIIRSIFKIQCMSFLWCCNSSALWATEQKEKTSLVTGAARLKTRPAKMKLVLILHILLVTEKYCTYLYCTVKNSCYI